MPSKGINGQTHFDNVHSQIAGSGNLHARWKSCYLCSRLLCHFKDFKCYGGNRNVNVIFGAMYEDHIKYRQSSSLFKKKKMAFSRCSNPKTNRFPIFIYTNWLTSYNKQNHHQDLPGSVNIGANIRSSESWSVVFSLTQTQRTPLWARC